MSKQRHDAANEKHDKTKDGIPSMPKPKPNKKPKKSKNFDAKKKES